MNDMEKAIEQLNKSVEDTIDMEDFVKSLVVVLEEFGKSLSELSGYIAESHDEKMASLYNEAVSLTDSIKGSLSDLRFEEHDSD